MQQIDPNYRAVSDDPSRNCDSCNNFQPVAGTEDDGRCFGNSVTRSGVCDFFAAEAAEGASAS